MPLKNMLIPTSVPTTHTALDGQVTRRVTRRCGADADRQSARLGADLPVDDRRPADRGATDAAAARRPELVSAAVGGDARGLARPAFRRHLRADRARRRRAAGDRERLAAAECG